MAKRMNGTRCFAVLMIALMCAPAGAAELRDPTRPPSVAEAAPRPGAGSSPATVGALTAIRIDAHQRIATIGGNRIRVGDRLGDGSVRAIRRTEVVLATPTGNQVLKLYPGVRQQARAAGAGAGTRVARAGEPRQLNTTPADGGATSAPLQGEPQ